MTIAEKLAGAVREHQARAFQAAEVMYQEILDSDPNQSDALHLLGLLMHQTNRSQDAIELIRRAIDTRPGVAEFHCSLGSALRGKLLFDEAVSSFREALRLKPEYAAAHNNLGTALRDQGNPEVAEVSFRNALQIQPDYADAANNLGNALRDQRRFEEAQSAYQEALRLDPNRAKAHLNRGMLSLLMGDFRQGWPEYDLRPSQSLDITGPRWDGSCAPDKDVLIHAEQGLGDTLQFIRFAALVKPRVRSAFVRCPVRCTRCFRRSLG